MGAGVMQSSGGGGRRRGRRRSRARPMSEINVTPFVDVMLVLLIVFMVAALSLVFSVVASLSVPVFFILRNDRDGLPLSPGEWALALGFFLLAAVLCVVGTVLPVRKAAPGLWGRNL